MEKLQIGDRVQVASSSISNKNKFETVYAFGHYEPQGIGEFLRIWSSALNTDPLEISAMHMVFVEVGNEKKSRSRLATPASLVVIGDVLVGGAIVTRIDTVQRKGVYAPFTESGTLVVNQVLVSNYISLTGKHTFCGWDMQRAAHLAVSCLWGVHRHIYNGPLLGNRRGNEQKQQPRYTEDGIAVWVPRRSTIVWIASHEKELFGIGLLLVSTAVVMITVAAARITSKRL